MAQAYAPPSLPVGTEVSAKYRGAFCEATVKTVVRMVKCKVVMKDCQTSVFVADDEIKGLVKLSSVVEVKHPDTGQPVEGTINKLVDQSTYTVVFDDGDERTLRRTQLCLKGDKHFIESETLDNLPLSHPEHFGTPVLQNKKARRRNGDESEEEEEAEEDDSEEESPRRARYRGRHQELVGKLKLVDVPNRKGVVMPALVVLPDANSLNEVKGRDQILLRSFKDSKFLIVNRKDLKEFVRSVAIKNEDKTMRTAFEKALLFYDTKELPVGWNRSEMLGSDVEDDDDDNEEDEYASEDEPFEEKDRFVAQLYKFMDDRGTPINKGPCIGNKDLNLYKLFKIVQHLGGYNKVTKEMKWPVVYSKMGLPSLHQNPSHQVKTAYKKYLDAYETFYRKLGSTMGTLSRPGRSRPSSSRGILNFRAREKSPRSPKPTEKIKEEVADSPKSKAQIVVEKLEDMADSSSVASTEEIDVVTRRTPRREPRVTSMREDSKERKDELNKIKETALAKAKKEEAVPSKPKREDVTPGLKGKKAEVVKGKKEEEALKKEERKSVRKVKTVDDNKESQEKEDKKPARLVKKEKEEEKTEVSSEEATSLFEATKKRVTRRKLLHTEAGQESAAKVEEEDSKDATKKAALKDIKSSEKKDKEIPKTLERRDGRASDKKEGPVKATETKEITSAEKKSKFVEKKKKKDSAVEDAEEDSSDEKSNDSDKTDPKVTFPIGTRLRVKYGKGKNQKIYIAKVVDHGKDSNQKTFRVHYAGWNTRYDEWIRSDRVVSVVERPDLTKLVKPTGTPKHTPTPLPVVAMTSTTTPAKKVTTPPKTPVPAEKTNIFRTPKVIVSKARSTRSSSTDNTSTPLVKRIGARKRMTRRGSTVTDSAGSQSPESQLSSDEDGDESNKDEKEDDTEGEVLNVDDEEEEKNKEETVDEENKIKGVESPTKDDSALEPASQLKGEEVNTTDEQVKKTTSVTSAPVEEGDSSSITLEEASMILDEKPSNNVVPSDENKEVSPKNTKSSVAVTEVSHAVDEIVSLVPDVETKDTVEIVESKIMPTVAKECKVNLTDENKVEDTYATETVKLESSDALGGVVSSCDVDKIRTKEHPADIPKTEIVKEKISMQSEMNQSIPQLKKEVIEQITVEKAEEKPVGKTSRIHRKKDQDQTVKEDPKKSVRLLDTSKTDTAHLSAEIPMLEPMTQEVKEDIARQQKEPSPYDFEEEADTAWKPDIGKKYEPSSLSAIATADLTNPSINLKKLAAAEDENEKKKVKKKMKKKPVTPEFIAESKTEDEDQVDQMPPKSADNTEEVPVPETSAGEKVGLRKKGRKKKDSSGALPNKSETSKQLANVDSSVAEDSKQSFQEAEQDQEQLHSTKRRRPKRISESDTKDVIKPAKIMRKSGPRSISKPSDNLTDTKPVVEVSQSHPQSETITSSKPHEQASTSVAHRDEAPGREANVCESQGFEPQSDSQDGGDRTFDNTPPTTPEHDDSGDNNQPPKGSHKTLHSSQFSSVTSEAHHRETVKAACHSSSATSSIALSVSSSTHQAQGLTAKCSSESPSDNDVISTASTDNLDSGQVTQQGSEGSGTDQDVQEAGSTAAGELVRKKRPLQDGPSPSVSQPKKKKRVHGTRSRTAKKSPKYIPNSDSQGSASNTPVHYPPESPPVKFADLAKSPRPSKYNFNADLGEYLEGEARCNFLITKMKEIKSIYMNLKSEVATIDRRRKRAKRKEKEGGQVSSEKDNNST